MKIACGNVVLCALKCGDMRGILTAEKCAFIIGVLERVTRAHKLIITCSLFTRERETESSMEWMK